jgi:hypothetical protein
MGKQDKASVVLQEVLKEQDLSPDLVDEIRQEIIALYQTILLSNTISDNLLDCCVLAIGK